MYDRIVIPTDGSSYADAAAATGFELADRLDAAVFVICVVDPGPLGSIRLPGDAASAEDALSERAREFVSRIESRGRDRGLDITTAIRHGGAVDEILEYVRETDADLVVMGSRGRGGLDRVMLGSVTEGVSRYGEVDVLVAGGDGDSNAEDDT